MIVLICGDRNWNNFKVIEDLILTLPEGTKIVEGNCKGADKISGYLGRQHGFVVISIPADWKKYGRRAGPIRNQSMLDTLHPDWVVAFHNDIKHSRGTKDMIERAQKAGIKVTLINDKNEKKVFDYGRF